MTAGIFCGKIELYSRIKISIICHGVLKMETWYEEPKVVVNGEERHIVVHIQSLPAPITCARAHAHEYIEMLYCLSGTHEIR